MSDNNAGINVMASHCRKLEERIAKLEARNAVLEAAAKSVVESAGNWMREAQHSDALIVLMEVLKPPQEKE